MVSQVTNKDARQTEVNPTYTITFGDVAENHAGMQKIGVLHERGFTLDELTELKGKLDALGLETRIHSLSDSLRAVVTELTVDDAHVLVIRKGVQYMLHGDASGDTSRVMRENRDLQQDTKALMRGRVVNKRARYNLCFAEFDQEPEYTIGKGRVVSYERVPLVSMIRKTIRDWCGHELNGEGNYYYDHLQCGIGYHGDSERRKVFAFRMGHPMPLYFQWFHRTEPVGPRIKLDLDDGDMYVMCEKSVGSDWKKRVIPTLRHATGSDKYTVIQPPKRP
jgi:hypothetical protein